MLRARLVGGHERQVDFGLDDGRELHLCLLSRLLEPLQGHPVVSQIDTVALLKLVGDPFHDPMVEVVAPEVCIAIGGLDLDHALAHLENRNVEGAAAEVVDRDGLVLLLVQPVGERRGRRFVDDSQHLQTGTLAGILGGLTLSIIEIRRHRDDRPLDGLP